MRKKTVQVLLGAALIAAMCLGAPTAASGSSDHHERWYRAYLPECDTG